MSSRNFCWTLNNYTDDEEVYIQSLRSIRFIGYAREVGKINETPHLQGVVCFKHPRKFEQLFKLLPRCHVSIMGGTFWQAWTSYIETGHEGKKPIPRPEDLYQWGDPPCQPGENVAKRYDGAWAAAKAGRLDDIPKDLRIRHFSTLNTIAHMYAVVPDLDEVCGTWIVGPSGCGKSRYVRATYGDTAYDKQLNKWWDGYRPDYHQVAFLDDLDCSHHWMALSLNRWADRYAFQAEVKGGTVKLRPKEIIVTSRYTIDEIFNLSDQSTRESIARRFKKVIDLTPL